MGLLKKLTKPLSKFLDKIVPNELKPALPYLSAFAPYMLGPGIMGSSMLQRALMSGGMNLASQLSQEGSEGEFSGLSALLAAGQGAIIFPLQPDMRATPSGALVTGTGKITDFYVADRDVSSLGAAFGSQGSRGTAFLVNGTYTANKPAVP